MADLVALAEQLREIRAAHRRFLAMWAVDCLLDRSHAEDRLNCDLRSARETPESTEPGGDLTCRGHMPR